MIHTSSRARLEAELRAPKGMTYDNLVVYADLLQAEGDLRGELISLDLVAPKDRYAAAATSWRERRQAVLAEWLGATLADEVSEHFDLGFVKSLDQTASPALLASPVGEYIRAFTVESARDKLEALAARPRPWLQRLEIRDTDVDDDLADQLVEALPLLARLAVGGRVSIERFPHPTMRFLAIESYRALAGLFDPEKAHPFPAVNQLEFAIRNAEEPPPADEFALTPAMFPVVISLDLRRCTGPQPQLLDLIRAQPICARLELVDLPALESEEAVESASRLLDAMPKLTNVRAARTYGGPVFGGELAKRRPPVEFPAPFPWPAPDSLKAYNSLVVRIPDEPFDDIVAIPSLIAFLEKHFETFSPEARAAWTTIWDAIRPMNEYGTYDEEGEWIEPPVRDPIPISVVATAVDACEAFTASDSRTWSEFRAHFRHSIVGVPATTPIKLTIYRG